MATIHIPLYLWFLSIAIIFLPTLAHLDTYIIHMDLASMPKAFSSHHSWYLTTLESISNTSTKATTNFVTSSKLLYAYTNAIHGFSAILSPTELKAMKNSPGYVASIKDKIVKKDTTHSFKFLGLNSNYGAWPISDYGKDVIIGLVDTGVWPESKSYNDHGMTEIPARWKGECESGTQFNSSTCNRKLIGARFFNKGLLAKFPNLTISMNSARDTDGHGTHTSSTAAGGYVEGASFFGYATGTATGMAPQARVAMYKALWDEGAYSSDIVAAIDQALIDGVDVLSLSFGLDDVPLYADPVAVGTFAALEKGIFVSTSAGNEGPLLGTLHNGTPWVLTVAAGTIDRKFTGTVSLGNGISISGLSLYPGNSTVTKIPIIFMDKCENLTALKEMQGRIVVCQNENQKLSNQVNNVQRTTVAGGVFITTDTDLEFFLESEFPAVFLNIGDGEKVLDYIKSSSAPKANLQFHGTQLGTKPAPRVTRYSSRGPSQSCPFVMKPDIMAPGSLVLAAWSQISPVAVVRSSGQLFNNFNIISGTSMSCPHAAGVAALLRGVHPDWSPAAIRSAMMTTADILDNTNHPITDIGFGNEAATPLAMGAGFLNPNKALDPGLLYDVGTEDYINLLCAMNYTSNQIQIVTRSSSSKCSKPSLDLNYPSFIAYIGPNGNQSTKQEFQRTVTNVGDEMSAYSAKLAPLAGFKVSVTPDTLFFRQKYEKKSYKLTIEGPSAMKGSVGFGYLSWEDTGGKHIVRSPIVATSLTLETLSRQN